MKGWGKFKSPHEIEVSLLDGGTSTVKAKNTIIATGSEVTPLPGITIDEERCVAVPSALPVWARTVLASLIRFVGIAAYRLLMGRTVSGGPPVWKRFTPSGDRCLEEGMESAETMHRASAGSSRPPAPSR